MKIQKTEKLALDYGNEVYINTYVSSWSGNVELKFNDYASDSSEHHLVLTMSLDKARALVKELTQDLKNYEMEQAKKEAAETQEESDAE
jgi:hypothetical protein